MKLCRFELKTAEGEPRSGMVYGGKVYETEGTQAIAVHEAQDIRPLAPVQNTGSVRLFRQDAFPDPDNSEGLQFFYGNPASIIGPSRVVIYPEFSGELVCEPYIAAVVVQNGYALEIEDADDIILGLTVMNVIVAKDSERRQGHPGGRSHDAAIAIGPVLTTPDELEDAISDSESGRKHKLSVVVRINGEERAQGDTEDLAISLAQAIAFASQSCTLRTGDVIGLGPLVDLDSDLSIEVGDEIQVAIERLGTLSTRISSAS